MLAVSHLILELVSLGIESDAVSSRLTSYIVVCFNARQGWIPLKSISKLLNPFKSKKNQLENEVMAIKNKTSEHMKE